VYVCATDSASSADNVASAAHKPRRRRNNRTARGNKRTGVSRPLPSSQQDEPCRTTGSDGAVLENGVDADNTQLNGSAKPQRRPHDKTPDKDAAATTTKQ